MSWAKALEPEHRRVLEALAHGTALTRTRLAESTGWSRNTVGARLDELLELGWVTESEAISSGGRPATVYSLNAGKASIFVAAFGNSHVTWGLVDLLGKILAVEDEHLEIAMGPDAAVSAAQEALARLCTQAGVSGSSVQRVVIGLPSPIHRGTGRPINPSVMPGWIDFDVRGAFQEAFNLPVSLENDAKLMALGTRLQRFPEAQNLVFIKVATGIGAGVITSSVLQHGGLGMAGEIGHVPLARGDRPCDCGNSGCVVRYAAIGGVIQTLQEAGVDVTDLDGVVALASVGNSECTRALRQAGRYLGEIVAMLLAVVNPEIVVLGGTLASVGNDLLAGLRESLYALAHPSLTSNLQTIIEPNHDLTAIKGAAALGLTEMLMQSSKPEKTSAAAIQVA